MQKTRFSTIFDQIDFILLGFLKSSWRIKSINLLSTLFGYFLCANFITKFISEGKNELVMVPFIILLIEFIVRLRPSQNSKLYNFWSIIDKIRLGSIYALILEAFKLGS